MLALQCFCEEDKYKWWAQRHVYYSDDEIHITRIVHGSFILALMSYIWKYYLLGHSMEMSIFCL